VLNLLLYLLGRLRKPHAHSAGLEARLTGRGRRLHRNEARLWLKCRNLGDSRSTLRLRWFGLLLGLSELRVLRELRSDHLHALLHLRRRLRLSMRLHLRLRLRLMRLRLRWRRHLRGLKRLQLNFLRPLWLVRRSDLCHAQSLRLPRRLHVQLELELVVPLSIMLLRCRATLRPCCHHGGTRRTSRARRRRRRRSRQ